MNARHGQDMCYHVLGPLEVRRDGELLDLGPRQRRVLLIRLLLEDGRPVSLAELAKSLWQGDRPTAAVSSIRAHVSRLRAVLEPGRAGRPSVLVSGPAGYALHVPPEARDTTGFDRSVGRAREALAQGRPARARQEVDAALALWRGTALGEAADHAFAQQEKSRLGSALQDARELRTTVLLQQGDLERAVQAAEELVATAPLREASWSLLIRALYAAGRSVDSLSQYERFRVMLAREMGLDPSPALRELHTAVLRHDTAVLGSPRPPGTLAASAPAHPPAATPLVGRDLELAQLSGLWEPSRPGHARWAVVSGEQGTGRSRLLDELAARASESGLTVVRTRYGREAAGGGAPACPVLRLLDTLCGGGPDSAGSLPDEGRAGVPTLCLVDDLDRASPGVHDRLRRAAPVLRDAPLVIVCAVGEGQPPALDALLAELARLDTTWLHLAPLDAGEVGELLAALGEDAGPDHAVALHRRSAGNPFLLHELLKLPAHRRTGPGAVVPAAVRSIVQAQLSALPAACRAMLTHAAADGGRLDIDLVARMRDVERERLLTSIDDAVTARLLVWHADRTAAEGHYRVPELVGDVLLGALTPSSRQLLHAAFARALDGRPGTDPARLAAHLDAAGPMAPAAASRSVRLPRRSAGH
ncbi:DNA-binding SARP family transcriptional activator [Streptomyces sp. B3I7]|uniref:BTAD domain-containing putative transcriptional regulator n=1 Tax=Streptomyces sp. B3I7 TaxID=3042269 RepID=UPI002787DFF9|nr:BTAD domain-containing putative transcriptional regulator [Streptomyces sp. B3I7]MDQ0808589.1 DNA-binding SARP family transcriptional activator [Streptomyces sp. B3I7]